MLGRCRNPHQRNYKDYGGRGIVVCARWHVFENFLTDIGQPPSPKHSLERIDNSKGYEPGNCKWATRKEQALNRRDNHLLNFRGQVHTITEWAEVLGLSRNAIYIRLARGKSVADALTTPLRRRVYATERS